MGCMVLVVEDDTDIRHLICVLLRMHGYIAFEAVDGVDALDKLNQHHPDLLVLDVMMPKMDGIELCRELRQKSETVNLPVVMLSGKAEPEAIEAGIQAGADRYLTKPAGIGILAETVRELLGEHVKQSIPVV